MLVTSSMILTRTGSSFPAASAAKVTGSRRATVRANSISPAADSQVSRNAAAISSAAKSCRRGRDPNSASAAILAHARRDSIRRAPDRNPTSWSSDSSASPVSVRSGRRVEHHGQERTRRHGVGPAVRGEPLQGQVLRRRGHVQPLRECLFPASQPPPGSPEPGGSSGSGDSAADMAHLAD